MGAATQGQAGAGQWWGGRWPGECQDGMAGWPRQEVWVPGRLLCCCVLPVATSHQTTQHSRKLAWMFHAGGAWV